MLAICVDYCIIAVYMKIIQIYKEFQSLKTVEEKISYLEMLSYCNIQFDINFNNIIRNLEKKQVDC